MALVSVRVIFCSLEVNRTTATYVPEAHPEQVAVPVVDEYMPAPQLEQMAVPVENANVPAPQLVQPIAPRAANDPAAHKPQVVVPSEEE